MKQSISVLAEIMALPISDLFLKNDPIKESAIKSQLLDTSKKLREQIPLFQNELDAHSLIMLQYLNLHTEIPSVNEFQALLHFAFKAQDIINCTFRFPDLNDPATVINQYYIVLLCKISKSFLTNRSGKAVMKPWDSSANVFHVFNSASIFGSNTEKTKFGHGHFFAPQQIEAWHSILQCIPEDVLISSYAALLSEEDRYAQKKNSSFHILKSFGETASIADSLLDKVLAKGMAETHIHAGASRSFGIIWESMLKSALKMQHVLEKNKGYTLMFKDPITEANTRQISTEAAIIRLVLADYLQSQYNNLQEYFNSESLSLRCRTRFLNQTSNVLQFGSPEHPFCDVILPEEPFLMNYPRKDAFDLWAILQLPKDLHLSMPTLAERCFLSWSFQQIFDFPGDVSFTALFLYYLRLKSSVYRCRIQDSKSKGLLYFQRYYSFSTDKGTLANHEVLGQIIYTALQDSRVVKTELRLSPPSFSSCTSISQARLVIKKKILSMILSIIREHLFALILIYGKDNDGNDSLQDSYARAWRMATARIRAGQSGILKKLLLEFHLMPNTVPPHRIGIIYHLIKHGEDYEQGSCFARKDDTSEIDIYKKFSFGRARFQYAAVTSAICDVRDLCPAVSRLIVGIDAASLEIPTEPWVFAPAFTEARRRNAILSYEGKISENKALLGVTYHVGEDFRHPLSGLRHVDEAIRYLKMRVGDRIGHGLVLGIDINRWFRLHGLIAVSRIEWMENCLWLWSIISKEAAPSTISKHFKYVENQIMKSAHEIYGSLDGVTIESLYQSYVNKTRPIEYIQSIAVSHQHDCKGDIDCFRSSDSKKLFHCILDRENISSWTEEWLSLSYHCSYYKTKMDEPILIIPAPEQIELTISLQQYLREKIANLGLVVESNPSSNSVIGEMDGVLQHPVGDLRNNDLDSVMASINTDDPSVFNASVANEHAQIYYSLRHRGNSIEKSLSMVDELREIGLRTSFLDEVIPLDQLLAEYEDIIRAIEV